MRSIAFTFGLKTKLWRIQVACCYRAAEICMQLHHRIGCHPVHVSTLQSLGSKPLWYGPTKQRLSYHWSSSTRSLIEYCNINTINSNIFQLQFTIIKNQWRKGAVIFFVTFSGSYIRLLIGTLPGWNADGDIEDDYYWKMNLYFASEFRNYLDTFNIDFLSVSELSSWTEYAIIAQKKHEKFVTTVYDLQNRQNMVISLLKFVDFQRMTWKFTKIYNVLCEPVLFRFVTLSFPSPSWFS